MACRLFVSRQAIGVLVALLGFPRVAGQERSGIGTGTATTVRVRLGVRLGVGLAGPVSDSVRSLSLSLSLTIDSNVGAVTMVCCLAQTLTMILENPSRRVHLSW